MPLVPDRAGARRALQLPGDAALVALLPGSRRGEVSRLASDFIAAAATLSAARPALQFIVEVQQQDQPRIYRVVLGTRQNGGNSRSVRMHIPGWQTAHKRNDDRF